MEMRITGPNAVEPLLMTPREAAVALRCGTTKLYELLGNGTLESVTIGRSRRIKYESVKRVAERGAN